MSENIREAMTIRDNKTLQQIIQIIMKYIIQWAVSVGLQQNTTLELVFDCTSDLGGTILAHETCK